MTKHIFLTVLLLLSSSVFAQNIIDSPEYTSSGFASDKNAPNEKNQSQILDLKILRFTGNNNILEQGYQLSLPLNQATTFTINNDLSLQSVLSQINQNQYLLSYRMVSGEIITASDLLLEKNRVFILFRQKGLKITMTLK